MNIEKVVLDLVKIIKYRCNSNKELYNDYYHNELLHDIEGGADFYNLTEEEYITACYMALSATKAN